MTEGRKLKIVYDAAFIIVPLLLVAAGIYFMRAPRVAVLNLERVLRETGVTDRIGKSERRWVSATFAQVNEVTERSRAKAAELSAKLEKTTVEADKKDLQEQIRILQMEVQAAAERVRQEFQRYREGAHRDIMTKLDPVVSKIARAHHFDLVIDCGDHTTVLYARTAVDITDEVMKPARSVLAAAEFGVLGPAEDVGAIPGPETERNRPSDNENGPH